MQRTRNIRPLLLPCVICLMLCPLLPAPLAQGVGISAETAQTMLSRAVVALDGLGLLANPESNGGPVTDALLNETATTCFRTTCAPHNAGFTYLTRETRPDLFSGRGQFDVAVSLGDAAKIAAWYWGRHAPNPVPPAHAEGADALAMHQGYLLGMQADGALLYAVQYVGSTDRGDTTLIQGTLTEFNTETNTDTPVGSLQLECAPAAAAPLGWMVTRYTLTSLPSPGPLSLTPYVNARFGFRVSIPPDPQEEYSVREADNGDGITVTNSHQLELRVYGTNSYAALGQDFAATVADMRAALDMVTFENLSPGKDWFVLSGYKDGAIVYTKVLYTEDNACVLNLQYPKADKARYDALVNAAAKSFARTGPTAPVPAQPPLVMVTPLGKGGVPPFTGEVYPYTAPNGENGEAFLLEANQPLPLLMYSMVRKDERLIPDKLLRRLPLNKGDACLLKLTLSEGIPGFAVCAGDAAHCWAPAYSGKDGRLILAPGFSQRER